jgi:Sulfotransferase family
LSLWFLLQQEQLRVKSQKGMSRMIIFHNSIDNGNKRGFVRSIVWSLLFLLVMLMALYNIVNSTTTIKESVTTSSSSRITKATVAVTGTTTTGTTEKTPQRIATSYSQLVETGSFEDVHSLQNNNAYTSGQICSSMLEDVGKQGEHKPILFSKLGTWDNPITTTTNLVNNERSTIPGSVAITTTMTTTTTTTTLSSSLSTKNTTVTTPTALTDIMVCRTPKVGSSMLRKIHFAFYNPDYMIQHNMTWETGGPPSTTQFQHMLGSENTTIKSNRSNIQRFHYLTSNDSISVARIMFVRHPVIRIVSGYRQIYCISHRHCQNRHYRAFSNFVFSQHRIKGLQNTYRPTCENDDEHDFHHHHDHRHDIHWNASIDKIIQHWAPPQHCRCGIHDCGIQYTYYHLERIPSVQYVLHQYLLQLTVSDTTNYDHHNHHGHDNSQNHQSPSWMTPTHTRANANGNTEQMVRFLLGNLTSTNKYQHNHSNSNMDTVLLQQPPPQQNYTSFNTTILDYLNDLTRPEQEYFGYLPLTVQNILHGTVDLMTDSSNHNNTTRPRNKPT